MGQKDNQIVIVDDETEILDMLSEDFKEAGYKVWCAENISSGLALVRSLNPAVVITDMHLPLGGGKDLFDEVLGFPKEIRPIMIFITGNTLMPVDIAFDQGAEGYITKPFVRNDVIQYVNWLREKAPERWRTPSANLGELNKPTITLEREFPSLEIAKQSKGIGLGRGGIFIRMKEDLPEVGSLVNLDIKLGSPGSRILGKGIVRWRRDTDSENETHLPLGVGVEYAVLDSHSIKYLVEEVGTLTLLPYIPKS
ncbi:MAG: response regulator [Bdellovibrio sp.]|nr:response regulator [Bdellovibrio sp.]